MFRNRFENKAWQWATLLFLSLIWGSSFILMKKGLRSFSHDQVAALRLFISFIAFIPFGIKNLKKVTRNNIVSLLIIGFIGSGAPAFLFTKAQTQIDSSLAGILNALTPLFTLIIGLIFYKSTAKLINAVGIVLGLIGALGLILQSARGGIIADHINYYGLFVIAATICYGINVNQVRYKIKGLSGLELTSLAFMFIGPLAGIYLLFTDFSTAFSTNDALLNLAFIAILAIVGTMLALVIFNTLIQHTSAIFGSSVTYIIPVFAIMWGLFDGETLSIMQFFWIALIIVGVYLVNKKSNNLKQEHKTLKLITSFQDQDQKQKKG
ncbi:MAG: DMT family transporter [Bacteroidales bacterium]|jgi:drug/metabolite transporter (DMT)-like permease|nr:DMT family transporter [Bacteroidales bacterium]